jgi:hypothetical protein
MRHLIMFLFAGCAAPVPGGDLHAGPVDLTAQVRVAPLANQLYDNGDCSAPPPTADSLALSARLTGSVPAALEIAFGDSPCTLTAGGDFEWSDGTMTIAGAVEPDGAHTDYWPSRSLLLTRLHAVTLREGGACEITSTWSGALTVELR